MQASLVITLIGTDRPGIVARVAALAADSGASWQQSKMARLGGKFAGIVRLDVPGESLEALERSLGQMQSEGLRLTIERGAPQVDLRCISLELVGCDRCGIVRDVSSALARHGVGIHEFDTEVASASMSGEQLFRMHAEILLPEDTVLAALRADLEAIADELMVDLTVDTGSTRST